MEWNYYNTFITVAADCPATAGLVPPPKKTGKTKPQIEFELAAGHSYVWTQEELLYETHVRHKAFTEAELAAAGTRMRDEFFQRPMPCLRASMLPKKYGWGIHFDAGGKLALVSVDSPEYRSFAAGEHKDVKVLPAMRNSKK